MRRIENRKSKSNDEMRGCLPRSGWVESVQNGVSHRRQVIFYRIPYDLVIDALINMPEQIPQSSIAFPVKSRAKCLSRASEPDRCLGDDLKLEFNSGFGLLILPICFKVHIVQKFINVIDTFQYVSKVVRASLKGNDCLAHGFCADGPFHPLL